jgi:hypothetical protein
MKEGKHHFEKFTLQKEDATAENAIQTNCAGRSLGKWRTVPTILPRRKCERDSFDRQAGDCITILLSVFVSGMMTGVAVYCTFEIYLDERSWVDCIQ